jgi:hypothetical protein
MENEILCDLLNFRQLVTQINLSFSHSNITIEHKRIKHKFTLDTGLRVRHSMLRTVDTLLVGAATKKPVSCGISISRCSIFLTRVFYSHSLSLG